MRPVTRDEVLGLGEYEAIRAPFRARVVAEKKARRIAIGDRATAVFENRDTVLLQIQEMLRTERITKESSIVHEIETYNALVPGPNELSATMMVEIDEREERERFLVAAAGLERRLFLETAGLRLAAIVEESRVQAERTTAVHYLKFRIPDDRIPLLDLAFVVDHPAFRARTCLPRVLVQALSDELTSP